MFAEYPDLMTVEKMQAALGVGRSTAYKLLRENAIRHFNIGKTIKIPKRYLIDFIESACYNAATATGSPSN